MTVGDGKAAKLGSIRRRAWPWTAGEEQQEYHELGRGSTASTVNPLHTEHGKYGGVEETQRTIW